MRRLLLILLMLGSLAAARAADAPVGHVVKVLPLFLDLQGHDAISPSLYDRDAYQVFLREHTNQVSAIRFDVLWRVTDGRDAMRRATETGESKLKLRLELRGVGPDNLPRLTTLEQNVAPHFLRQWTSFPLAGDAYKKFGAVVAWRATLWADGKMLDEQESFLWRT
jgi:hypothetical protein